MTSSEKPFTTGWRVAIIIALLAAFAGSGGADRRARSEAASLRSRLQRLEGQIRKLQGDLAELQKRPR